MQVSQKNTATMPAEAVTARRSIAEDHQTKDHLQHPNYSSCIERQIGESAVSKAHFWTSQHFPN